MSWGTVFPTRLHLQTAETHGRSLRCPPEDTLESLATHSVHCEDSDQTAQTHMQSSLGAHAIL